MRASKRRIQILWPGYHLDDLDLWPGTEVWYGGTWQYLGHANNEGVFVAYMSTLN